MSFIWHQNVAACAEKKTGLRQKISPLEKSFPQAVENVVESWTGHGEAIGNPIFRQ